MRISYGDKFGWEVGGGRGREGGKGFREVVVVESGRKAN